LLADLVQLVRLGVSSASSSWPGCEPGPDQFAIPPVIALMKASCWARIASKPGMAGIPAMGLVRFSIILVCPSRSISKLIARNCGTTDCACVV
jgi:hypothetical protein